ncbi:MAG: T9SS type A sorting domain-containing protein [Ignavibacteriales bacterium]|nr:MAG: T9SS type A sorting domain-containing protein [Ignavibacteriales bacterium]
MAIDNNSNTYIVGQTYSNSNIITVKYNSSGIFQWAETYDGPSNSQDNPVAIGVDNDGNVFSTGNSLDTTSGYDIAIIKYVQNPTSVDEDDAELSSFTLEQNYPNPFNPMTKINFTIPLSETLRGASVLTTLKVYDVLGKEIATLVNEEKPTGSYEVDFNASGLSSGIYFYKLNAGKYSETKKMILVK